LDVRELVPTPDCTGISAVPPEVLYEAILMANAHGLAATVHAIGDRRTARS
jgi:predicted amidohydrolase YtcJ